MKSVLLAVGLFLFSSCGLVAKYAEDIEIPVNDAQQFTDWAATMPRFDFDGDGIIDATEFDTFITWFVTQVVTTYAAPVAGPRGPAPAATVVLPEPTEPVQ